MSLLLLGKKSSWTGHVDSNLFHHFHFKYSRSSSKRKQNRTPATDAWPDELRRSGQSSSRKACRSDGCDSNSNRRSERRRMSQSNLFWALYGALFLSCCLPLCRVQLPSTRGGSDYFMTTKGENDYFKNNQHHPSGQSRLFYNNKGWYSILIVEELSRGQFLYQNNLIYLPRTSFLRNSWFLAK